MNLRNFHTAGYKWLITVFYLVIVLLLAGQLFWLNKIYNYQQKEFNISVVKSIKGIYEDLELRENSGEHLQNLIEQPDEKSFLFKTDRIPSADSVASDAAINLEDFGVFTSCIVAVYDSNEGKYVQTHYLPSAAAEPKINTQQDWPLYKKNHNYILLLFPHRNKYIFTSMGRWIFSTTLLLMVLIALGVSNFKLYRQKFLNEIQNDFIRNVTHEFQTPLTTLLVGLDIIGKPGITSQPEKLAKYTGLMQAQTLYLKQHIENLSRVMQAESQGTTVAKESFDPNELVEEALAQLYQMIEESGAEIIFKPDNKNIDIIAEKGSLLVAIINLLTNAIKYSPAPVVTIQTSSAENWYTISVKDNGIGISKKMQRQLFKKFYRVPTGDVHNVRGLGLGLYFVKKAAMAHHGNISVVSEEGEGSEFIFKIPKKQ